jgi:hypothetical protein
MTKDELLNTLADMVAERMKGNKPMIASTRYELSNEDRDNAKKAANLLLGAFSWHGSREGLEYWERIHKRLLQIAEDGKL